MFGVNLTKLAENDTLLTLIEVYFGIVAVAVWLAIVIWVYRDMRARSKDTIVQLLAVLLVAIPAFDLPGLLIYLFLRPRETLSEAYERSLEEEALLQEIEEKPTCPGCGQRVQPLWQVCPNCRTRLKRLCVTCRNLLELSWPICPYCATAQGRLAEEDPVADYSKTTAGPKQRVSLTRKNPEELAEYNTDSSLEFVDGDEY